MIENHRFDNKNSVMLELKKRWKKRNPDRKSRAGGKKVGQTVGQKIVKKTRIVIENHRFDHKNNVMLELKKR